IKPLPRRDRTDWGRCAEKAHRAVKECQSRHLSAFAVFRGHAAAVHLVFETLHGRSTEVPSEASSRGAAAHNLLPEEGVEVVHGVDLGGRRVRPGAAELPQATLHLGQHEDCLLAHRFWAGLAVANGAFAVAGPAFSGFTTAGDDETRRAYLGGHREG